MLKDESNLESIGAEKSKLLPTEIGKITNDFLVNNFTEILDYNFTAKLKISLMILQLVKKIGKT